MEYPGQLHVCTDRNRKSCISASFPPVTTNEKYGDKNYAAPDYCAKERSCVHSLNLGASDSDGGLLNS